MSAMHSILIIGVGSIGERHLRCFQATKRCEVALCEINDALRTEVAGRYGVDRAFNNLSDALAQPFDAAVIATPAHTHIPIAIELAKADIHLLIEKPLSTSMKNIDALARLIRERRLTAAVAYVWRTHPVIEPIKRALDEGRFGRPVQLTIVTGQHFPTYRPAYRDIYYAHRKQGGGAIQDALTHMLNLGQWLVGPIDRLTADAAHQVLKGVDVEDTVHVLTRHDQVMGAYTLNQHQAPNETTITVCCDGGTCRAVVHENRWQWMSDPDSPWHVEAIEPLERDTLFVRQAHAFLNAIEGKAPPLCSLAEGAHTLAVNLAALRSADEQSRFLEVEDTG